MNRHELQLIHTNVDNCFGTGMIARQIKTVYFIEKYGCVLIFVALDKMAQFWIWRIYILRLMRIERKKICASGWKRRFEINYFIKLNCAAHRNHSHS